MRSILSKIAKKKQIQNFQGALKFSTRYSSQSQNVNFLQNSIDILLEMIENQRETKNPSTGKFRQPRSILPLFLPFSSQKRIKKGPDLMFLESLEPRLMF